MRGLSIALSVVAALGMVSSVVAVPMLAGGDVTGAGGPGVEDESADAPTTSETNDGVSSADSGDGSAADGENGGESDADVNVDPPSPESGLISMAATTPDAEPTALAQEHEDAVEQGVEEAVEILQRQNVEITQEQRAAAVEGAKEAVSQHQSADVEQVQKATTGAVHGALIQKQHVNVTQVQHVVGGAVEGGLAQHQTVNATQLQHATWGAAHGTAAQEQKATVEQLQFAARGAAAGAAHEAGRSKESKPGKIQEAAQGSAFGVIEQYQKVTVEQRQRITLDHVQNAAAGAAAGALEGSQRTVVEQSQRVQVEQRQRVTIKEIQKAAMGAARGALVQKQQVNVRQTQVAARGAAKGACKKIQQQRVKQVQKVTITQIQEASFGAAKGAITQSQEASVEQIQAAAEGSASGVLQSQRVSIVQTQYAATGAAQGAVQSAVQNQVVNVEQIQAAARGGGQGAVTQIQVVNVRQVQVIAQGASSGSLSQSQSASVTQIQRAAKTAGEATAKRVQNQRISVEQIQRVTQTVAADTTRHAVESETDDESELEIRAEAEADESADEVEEIQGTASVSISDQSADDGTVVVDSVELSEGGFVVIHDEGALEGPSADTVVGASSYLEPGEHEDVEIELDQEVAVTQSVVAIAHLDTTGDRELTFAETGGEEDHPYLTGAGATVSELATLEVEAEAVGDDGPGANETDGAGDDPDANETDDGADNDTDVADGANETDDDETDDVVDVNETDGANETVGGNETDGVNETDDGDDAGDEGDDGDDGRMVTICHQTGSESNPWVEITVNENAVDTHLEEHGDFVVDDENPCPPEDEADGDDGDVPLEATGTLEVDDQRGNGTNLTVAEANASVAYVLRATYPGGTVESDTLTANESVENYTLDLEPPLEENATVNVSVVDVETDEQLAAEDVEYVLEGPDAPSANLTVENQTGDGTNLTVANATASVDYYLEVRHDGGTVTTEEFGADESLENVSVPFDPPLEENATVNVSVVEAETDESLVAEEIEYTVEDDEPTVELEVENQSGDGTNVTVTAANASVDFYLEARYDGGTAMSEVFGADETLENHTLDLEPPLEENATIEVEVRAAADGAELANATIEYAVLEGPTAEIGFEDQTSAGTNVTVDEVNLSDGGYVAIYGESVLAEEDEIDEPPVEVSSEAILGVSEYLEPGEHENVTVDLFDVPGVDYGVENPRLEEGAYTLVAVPHLETNESDEITEVEDGEDEPFDYVESVGEEDGPYVDDEGVPVFDEADVTVDREAAGSDASAGGGEGDDGPESDDAAAFVLTDLTAPDAADPGTEIAVEATIENQGDRAATQTVSYVVDDTVVGETDVSLEPGEAIILTFSYVIPSDYPAGDSVHAVETGDDEASTTITIGSDGGGDAVAWPPDLERTAPTVAG